MTAHRPTTHARARVRREARVVETRHLRLGAGVVGVAIVVLAVGLGFAGSPGKLAAGTRIAGVDVGGLTPRAAQALLEQRSARLAHVPVSFVAGSERFSIRPQELGVTTDWARAVRQAAEKGEGNSLVRGFRRLKLRLFPVDVVPAIHSYGAAVNYEVGLIGGKVDRAHKEARLVRHGVVVEAVPGQQGLSLVRPAARRMIVSALGSLARRAPVRLPVRTDQPKVTTAQLAPALTLARRALSAPVTLSVRGTRRQLTPKELAPMLELPRDRAGSLVLGGNAADRYFARLDRTVGRPAKGAQFQVSGDHVSIAPAVPGLALDVPRSAAAVLAAAERARNRVAPLVVGNVEAGRTTAAAQAMGITGLVSSFETFYGGIPNRIHNVELVAHLVDNKLIAPGATFSFNNTTGARTAAKGFLEAPVIINGELSTGLGGGICQVSTTVFNAAYDAGLPITARTNHDLYISHYPLGRDATVDYPDIDLKFVNDTKHWLLLRTFVGSSSLVVSLYGTPQNRRVVTDTAPLRFVAPPPVKKTLDRSLAPGAVVVEDPGENAYSTSVRRRVYSADGKLLSDATWYSNYRASPKIVEVGPTKHKPKPKAKPAQPTEGPVGPHDPRLG